jgi:hypothetical protein
VLVLEITCATDTTGTLATFYVATEQYATQPTDSPASTSFDPCVIDPGSLGIHTFGDGRTGGTTKLSAGDITLANADGHLDNWLNYSFDGRLIVIRSGPVGAAYPAGFTTVFTGTMESLEVDWSTIIMRLRDKQMVFTLPVLTTTYGGTNVLPAGIDGTVADILGKVKPRVLGKVFSIAPEFVNTSKLIYQCNDGPVASVNGVYDKGAALTAGADYATNALLQATAPSAGTYSTCLAEGLIRLGSSAAGQITLDVTQGVTSAANTVGQLVKALALSAGLTSGEIATADVVALDSLNSSVVGIYINDNSTFQANMDLLLASVGGYMGFDSTGVLRIGVLTTPTGTPVVTIQEYDIQSETGLTRVVPKDSGIPIYRTTLNHSKVYTVQKTDLAGAVSDASRAFLGLEYRAAKAEDLSVKTMWKLAGEETTDTLLTSAVDAATEAARQLNVFKVRRDIYDCPISADIFANNGLKLMDVVQVVSSRYGMSSGKLFRIIGYTFDLANQRVILQIWG